MNEDAFITKLAEYSENQKNIMAELKNYLDEINKAVIGCGLFNGLNSSNQILVLSDCLLQETYIFFKPINTNVFPLTNLYLMTKQTFVTPLVTNSNPIFMNSTIKIPNEEIIIEYLNVVMSCKDEILEKLEQCNKDLISLNDNCRIFSEELKK